MFDFIDQPDDWHDDVQDAMYDTPEHEGEYSSLADMDSNTASVLEDTKELLREAREDLHRLEQEYGGGTWQDPMGVSATSSSADSTLDMLHHLTSEAQGIAEGRYSPEELEAIQTKYAHMTGSLEGMVAEQNVRNDVAEYWQNVRDADYASTMRQLADEAQISAESHLREAHDLLSRGESATEELGKAARDISSAAEYNRRASEYDPTKNG